MGPPCFQGSPGPLPAHRGCSSRMERLWQASCQATPSLSPSRRRQPKMSEPTPLLLTHSTPGFWNFFRLKRVLGSRQPPGRLTTYPERPPVCHSGPCQCLGALGGHPGSRDGQDAQGQLPACSLCVQPLRPASARGGGETTGSGCWKPRPVRQTVRRGAVPVLTHTLCPK